MALNEEKKGEKGKKKDDEDHISIKCFLRSIIREGCEDEVIDWIRSKAMEATKITVLASLLFLNKVNSAVDQLILHEYHLAHMSDEEILANPEALDPPTDFFSELSGFEKIKECFHAVVIQNKENEQMDPEFRRIVESVPNRFAWPHNEYFGNLFKYLISQYYTNVKTNLTTHMEKRLLHFFRMLVYESNRQYPDHLQFDNMDITNAMAVAMNRKKNPLDEIRRLKRDHLLRAIQFGPERNNNIESFTRTKWFESLPMWVAIQRQIFYFHERQQIRHNAGEDLGRVPNIKGFTVIPLCSFQRTHIRFDTDCLSRLYSEWEATGKLKRDEMTSKEFFDDRYNQWNQIFDLPKIYKLARYKKQFHCQLVTDGVGVSILFNVKKSDLGVNEAAIREQYANGDISHEFGIDRNARTWLAVMRKNVVTGTEMNRKIDSKQYHCLTKYPQRKRKAKRLTAHYTAEEEADLAANQMPSPMGPHWQSYIHHRLRMLKNGIDAYASDRYCRLRMDKYIMENRVLDQITGKLLGRNGRAIVYLGAADMHPNSPIGIKNRLRCPGTRRIARPYKKRNCPVYYTDEYNTSLHCGRCAKRFSQYLRPRRFKVCVNCIPDPNWNMMLPKMIVNYRANNNLKKMEHLVRLMEAMNLVGGPRRVDRDRLVTKVAIYSKICHANEIENLDEASRWQPLNTVWHRDITAARAIWYKGHCKLFGLEIHPNFRRPVRVRRQNHRN